MHAIDLTVRMALGVACNMMERPRSQQLAAGVLVLLACAWPLAQSNSSDPSVVGVDAYGIPLPRSTRVLLNLPDRRPFAGGESFGDVGPYEQLKGVAHLAFELEHEANTTMTDLRLAPHDEDGRGRATADVVILRPATPGRGNRRLLVDLVNRGNPLTPEYFNDADADNPAGNGFLMRQGYTIVQIGWQHDVPEGDGLRIRVPLAVSPNGGPVTGRVFEVFQPPTALVEWPLKAGAPVPHLPDSADVPDAELTIRETFDGPTETFPRNFWRFSIQQYTDAQLVPNLSMLFLPYGFNPNYIYQVTYPTSGAPVVGMGLGAIRNITTFLRYESAQRGNPIAGTIDHAYAYGQSQSARLLREFLYYALNLDEDGRQAFDGVILQGGGVGRGEFNRRFGQNEVPSSQVLLYRFPFTDAEQADPGSGRRDGLLARQIAKGGVPKVMHLHAGSEYWSGVADLSHTDVTGTTDVDPPDQVRIYTIAGAQSAFGTLPVTDQPPGLVRHTAPLNIVDYRPVTRAALVNLDRWVSANEAPPATKVPRVEDATLVPPERIDAIFGVFGTIVPPTAKRRALTSRIFSPWFEEGAEEGFVLVEAPPVGAVYVNRVPAVDADGNETAGIRLPAIAVPLATHTGWNFEDGGPVAPDVFKEGVGATLPFAATADARRASGDPRRSIAERYGSKDAYLLQVRTAAAALVEGRYLLAEDVAGLVEQAGEAYDAITQP